MKNEVLTKRWTRSPRGEILGVATGLAEWRGFPASTTRMLVFLAIMFTGFFPGCLVYLVIAIILPPQTESDLVSTSEWYDSYSGRRRRHKEYEDASFSDVHEKSTADLKKEYEDLKKKVEDMENEMFNREKDWDNRFNAEDRK